MYKYTLKALNTATTETKKLMSFNNKDEALAYKLDRLILREIKLAGYDSTRIVVTQTKEFIVDIIDNKPIK